MLNVPLKGYLNLDTVTRPPGNTNTGQFFFMILFLRDYREVQICGQCKSNSKKSVVKPAHAKE